MHIKLLSFAAAVALISGLGTASADGPFSVLSDVPANPLTPLESAHVVGGDTEMALILADREFVTPADVLDAMTGTPLGGFFCPTSGCFFPDDALFINDKNEGLAFFPTIQFGNP